MPDIADMKRALRGAHKAGDVEAATKLAKAIQRQQKAEPSTLQDIGQSLATGLRQGVEGLAGFAGDVHEYTADAAAWGAGKFGASTEVQDRVRTIARRASIMPFAPTTQNIQDATTDLVGEHYEPQTAAGEYARTVGQFTPAVAAGPGGVMRKAAMSVIPAVASETAGQVVRRSEFPEYEPHARAITAIGAGIPVAGSARANLIDHASKNAPTAGKLKQTTDAVYDLLDNTGIHYDRKAYADIVRALPKKLRDQGFRERAHPEVFDLAKDLSDDVAKGVVPDFREVESLRQMAGNMARDASASGKRFSAKGFGIIQETLDEFSQNAPFISNRSISTAELTGAQKIARALALRNIKQRELQTIINNADTYAAGQEAGIRNGIGNLLRSKRGMKLFPPGSAEREALLEVQHGRKTLRALSKFGFDVFGTSGNAALVPTLGGSAASAAGFAAGGPAGAVAAPAALIAAGTAAKAASPRATETAIQKVAAAMRAGKLSGGQGAKMADKMQFDRIVRALLVSGAGVNAARPVQPVN